MWRLHQTLKMWEDHTPAPLISSVLKIFNPKLHIVNVNKEHYISLTEEMEAEKKQTQ